MQYPTRTLPQACTSFGPHPPAVSQCRNWTTQHPQPNRPGRGRHSVSPPAAGSWSGAGQTLHRHRQHRRETVVNCISPCGGFTSIRGRLSDLGPKTQKTQTDTQTTNPKPPAKQRAVLTRPAHPSAPKTRSRKRKKGPAARFSTHARQRHIIILFYFILAPGASCKPELHAPPGPAKGGAGLQGGSITCRSGAHTYMVQNRAWNPRTHDKYVLGWGKKMGP